MDNSTKRTIKKTVKVMLISLISFVLFLFLIIAVAINFVFTPQKLTPVVVEMANKFLNAKVDIGTVNLTFFSTFPNFGLEVTDGTVISYANRDSLSVNRQYQKSDSLLNFKKCYIQVNPMAFITKREVQIKAVELSNTKIYAFIAEDGKPNWDIAKISADTASVQPLDTVKRSFEGTLDVTKISIKNAALTFDDRASKMYASTENLNFTLTGSLSKEQASMGVDFSTKNIILWQNGKVLLKRLDFGVATDLLANSIEKKYELQKASVMVNGLELGAKGSFKVDTLSKELGVNVNLGFKVPSLKTLLDLIPTSIVKEAVDFKAGGNVTMIASLNGTYGHKKVPTLKVSLVVKNGSVKYAKMPFGIDKLDADVSAAIDLTNRKKSFLKVNKFYFKGGPSVIDLKSSIVNLDEPLVDAKLAASVDFDALAKIFPLQDGVTFGGKLNANLDAKLDLLQIKGGNIGNAAIIGSTKMENMVLQSPKDTFEFKVASAGFKFGTNQQNEKIVQGKTLLNAIVGLDGLVLEHKKRINVRMDKVVAHLLSSPLKDTSSIVSVSGTVGFKRVMGNLGDSLSLNAFGAKANVRLLPSKNNKRIPVVSTVLSLDTLGIVAGSNKFLLDKAGFNTRTIKSERHAKHWISTGTVGFRQMRLYTPAFPIEMVASKTQLTLTEKDLELKNVHLQMGNSNLALNGKISNIVEQLFRSRFVKADLALSSDMVDLNQIMQVLDKAALYSIGADSVQVAKSSKEEQKKKEIQQKIDSVQTLTVFVVPKNIDFCFKTNIKQVKFGKLLIDDVKGDVNIRNQAVELSGLGLKTLGANMETSMVYRAHNKSKAYAAFILHMHDINIGKLIDFMPSMDTLLPMLKSFDGYVDFDVAMETNLDKNLNVVVPSVNGAAQMRGDSLAIFDSDTFRKIAKMMMFKNKKRNVVDSVSVFLQIKKSVVDVFPFVLQMDRYKVALGGSYKIDNKLDYHVSVLHSPVPFKLGIDIFGTVDDIDFKITRAKYKNLTIPAKRTVVDVKEIEVQNNIRRALRNRKE